MKTCVQVPHPIGTTKSRSIAVAAAYRVFAGGGQILHGPVEVPDGAWVRLLNVSASKQVSDAGSWRGLADGPGSQVAASTAPE
jgi:hypothetical protein